MNQPALSIPRRVRDAITTQARRERPHECCGFLLGNGARVAHAVPMRNVAASATRYRIDDVAHIELRRVLRLFAPALSIVGVYHSHPAGDAIASATDLAEAWYPEWAYVIVGLGRRRPSLRAFRIRTGRVRRLAIRWR